MPSAGSRVCEGMLIEGPQGWGEFSPPAGVAGEQAARWLTAAIEAGIVGWPDPLRGRVPVAVIVPAVSPEPRRRDHCCVRMPHRRSAGGGEFTGRRHRPC